MDEGWWSGGRYPTVKAVGTGAIVAGRLLENVAHTVAFAGIPHIRLPDLRIHFGTNS